MTILTEAQLVAHVLALAHEAFPHLEAESFKLEKILKFKVGRHNYAIDGAAAWTAEGRADLLLFYGGRPLAVIELKREDKPLTLDDLRQGQSYANILVPHPPLVIVSNGNETWVRQAHDGETLPEELHGAAMIEKIFENIGKLAAADNSWAIEVLMGPEASVWVEAVRMRTDELIERLTGEAGDSRKPFARGFLVHRGATDDIVAKFEAGAPTILVEGAPLAGKSSILRDLAQVTRASPDWAVLMVNGATAGGGLFQRIANLFGDALEWKLGADDVRAWLRRMSHSSRRPALILAVDGLKPGTSVAHDFEELAETGFGDGLRLIGCTDCADDILLDSTGRTETAIGQIAEQVTVDMLDDDEFAALQARLFEDRILFYPGAEIADEYRTPWVLRSVLSEGSAPKEENIAAVIPATMGLRLVRHARERFSALDTVVRSHRILARDALADQETPDAAVVLASANGFIVRRDALSVQGEAAAVALERQGWIRFYRHPTGEDLVGFRVPELFMSELAHELATSLEAAIDEEPDDAWLLLVCQAQRFFLGDIVGAHALFDFGKKRGGVPPSLVEPMMNDRPEGESMAGKVIGIDRGDGRILYFRFNDEGEIARANAQGKTIGDYAPLDEGDKGIMHGNVMSWMILSQLSAVRTGYGTGNRFDVDIMLWVGQAPMPLMRGGGEIMRLRAHAVQNLGKAGSVLAAEHAMAEPVTSAIHALFYNEWENIDGFFDQVIVADSLPLTARVHNALNMLRGADVPGLEVWGREKMATVIQPLLRRQMVPEPA